MFQDEKLVIVNEKGEQKEFAILVTFDIEKKNKSYVIYTDYSKNDDGDIQVYASIYDKFQKDKRLNDVTEKDEIEFINKYLEVLADDLKSAVKLV